MVALLNSPIDSLAGGDDDNEYKRMLMAQLQQQQDMPQDEGPSQNQLIASLSGAANQLGTIGGRTAQSPEVQKYADILDKNKAVGEQQKIAQLNKQQGILAQLAKMRDQSKMKASDLAFQDKKQQENRQYGEDQQARLFAQQKELEGIRSANAKDLAESKTQTKPSVAQTAVDRNFAKTYEDFVVQGGFADAEKGIGQLNTMADKLADNKTLTGPIRGATPDFIRQFTNPEALDVKSQVEDVVQRSLKAVLGGQFTEKEGQRVLERAYNEKSPPEVNEARIRRLSTQLKKMAEAKFNAAKYYEANGTLQGFPGTLVNSVDDVIANLEKDDKGQSSSGTAYAASPSNPLVKKAPEEMSDAELDQELMRLKGK